MKHCSIWSCDRSPTIRLEWKDDENRRCFGHFCDTHALEAEHRRDKGNQPATLEDLIMERGREVEVKH